VPTATSGNSLSAVVTTCTPPAARTPRALTQVSSQIAASAATAPNPGLTASGRQKNPR
jgi:hypothetical protein